MFAHERADVAKGLGGIPAGRMGTSEEIAAQGLELAGLIPEDPQLAEFDSQGRPTFTLPADSPALKGAYAIFDRLFT